MCQELQEVEDSYQELQAEVREGGLPRLAQRQIEQASHSLAAAHRGVPALLLPSFFPVLPSFGGGASYTIILNYYYKWIDSATILEASYTSIHLLFFFAFSLIFQAARAESSAKIAENEAEWQERIAEGDCSCAIYGLNDDIPACLSILFINSSDF